MSKLLKVLVLVGFISLPAISAIGCSSQEGQPNSLTGTSSEDQKAAQKRDLAQHGRWTAMGGR